MTELSDAARFVAIASREIGDGDICFVGIGVPSLAAITAKQIHAKDSVIVYESGAIDAIPPTPPLSTGSPSVVANTAMATSCLGVFAMLQQGVFDLGLLSAAQVDRFGNLNSTSLGAYARPKVRLVGSGGAHDIAVLARDIVTMMPHDPRRFVSKVDFITSPGLRTAANGMSELATRGRGPKCLVTPRARFTFEAGELTLDAVAHGLDETQALEGIAWDVPRAREVKRLPPINAALAAAADAVLKSWGRGAD
jgi:glutaconate CoA-transferase subunit B